MSKNYQNFKKFVSSYKLIYVVEIIDWKLVVSENWNILWSIEVDIDNPILLKWNLYIDIYRLLDEIKTVRALFAVFKRRNILLSPKQNKDESI